MNVKQLYIQSAVKPVRNSSSGINGKPNPLLQRVAYKEKKQPQADFIIKLEQLEELNNQLKALVENRTKQLTEATVANNRFLTIIAHDLRGPFGSVLRILEMVKDNINDYNSNEIEKFITMASNSVSKTYNLLESLLAWAISQNQEKSFVPVKTQLQIVVNDEIENFSASAIHKQITIHQYIAPDLFVNADFQMIKTILRNLISNAIKFTPPGGIIAISATEGTPFVEIAVKDNGIGISVEAQKKLFKIDEFHSTPGTNNEKGSGFGLLLSREFVSMHGGSLQIESEHGKGCVVKFTLPHYI